MYTGQQKNSEQPNFCSSFIDKIWSHKRSPDVRDRGKSPDKKKLKSESNDCDKNGKKSEIKSITTKMKRVTCTLPMALRSNGAYETGEKNCKVCSMTREQYKSDLNSAKVVSILVDGVIEKEQAEKMNEENEQELDEGNDKLSKDNGKGDKISFNLSVYCEGDVIKHSLKCVLIKLQKTLGDVMVQICFVKTRKLGNEEKYKKFDVSISDLKLLKYEYTNLTDAIIPLFKAQSTKKKNSTEVCVPCVKEKLCEYNVKLGEILKSGRNLRVVMRNDGGGQDTDNCCSRDYPHVHAEVHGKPIVLKYSMPFQVKPTSKTNEPPNETMEEDPHERLVSFQEKPTEEPEEVYPISQQERPYYEWPEDFLKEDEEHKPNKEPPSPVLPERPQYTSDSEIQNSSEDNLTASSNVQEKALQSRDQFHSPQKKSTPESSDASSVTFKVSSTSLFSNKSSAAKRKTSTQVVAPVFSKTSLFSQKSSKSSTSNAQTKSVSPQKSKKKLSSSEESDSSTDSEHRSIKSKKSTPSSSVYCGCNYNNAFEKLGSQPQKSKSNLKKITKDLTSSDSESTSSFLKDNPDKRDQKTFPYQLNTTAAFPVTAPQSSNFMSKFDYINEKRSSQMSVKNSQNAGKIASGVEKDTNTIAEHVPKVDSLVLTKERWSHGGEPLKSPLNVTESSEDKAVAAAFKTFIDEPKYEIKRVATKEDNSEHPRKDVNHQNKKLELLRNLGKENLMSICSPAECCKTNSSLDVKKSYSELPLSPSLDSLPLDRNDLEYLAKATGTPILYHDLMMLAENEVTAKNEEYEMHYADENVDLYKPRWLRAFGETDEPKETCNNGPTTHQTSSGIRRSSVKSVVIKEEPRLSTIVEEGPFCFYEDEKPSLPYMPSIPSLPLEEEEKAELIKKHRPSILKHTTMELRYFTVEFLDKTKNNKEEKKERNDSVGQFNDNKLQENNKLCFEGRTGKEMNKVAKTVTLTKAEVDKKSCDSFHSCSSSTELMNFNYDQLERASVTFDEELSKSKTDEIIMLNAIYLCDNNFDDWNNENTSKKTIFKNSEQDCIQYNDNTNSQNKISNMRYIPEINDTYVKNLISEEDKFQKAAKNKSFTIIKNTENKIICFGHMNDIISQTNSNNYGKFCSITGEKNEQSYNKKTTKVSYPNSLNLIKTLKDDSKNKMSTNFNNMSKNTSDRQIISINETIPKYIPVSVKLNQSYTVVTDTNQNINGKSGFSHQINSNPKISYTVIKNDDLERTNYTTEDVKKEPMIIAHSTLENVAIKKPIPNLKINTNNSPQNNIHKQSHWSKLKLEKSNVKNYLIEQRNYKQKTSMPEASVKLIKEFKRKPLILPQSRLSYRRMQCKVASPRIYFPNLQPVRISFRVPSISFVPNKLYKKFETIEESNKIKQRIGNTKGTQNLSSLVQVEKTKTSMLKSEPDDQFVQKSENKCNLQDINNPVLPIRKNMSATTFHEPDSNNKTSFDANTEHLYSNDLNLETKLLENKKSFNFYIVKSNTNLKHPQVQVDDCEIDEHLLIDGDNNPLYLFDCHGRPLTDQSGRTLRNIKGEFLIIFDEQNNPIRDLDNNPICDSIGHILNKKGFNSVKPPVEDVLKSFVRDSGDPILLYDAEGRPLTSVSGTMLVDSSGKSMIRFGCTDKVISDSMGRSIFDSNGEQFNGIG